MAKRRDAIRMSEEEIWDFVRSRKSLQVATLNKDGSPHLTTLWFDVTDDRAIVFETYTKSQKIRNLERDPRMAVLVEAGTTYGELRGVSMNGRAELVTDHGRVRGLAAGVMARNQPELSAEQAEQVADRLAAKRTAVVFRPEKIVSWDHRKLGGGY